MTAGLAVVGYAIVILTLFAFDRDRSVHTSKALWIPVLWLLIIGSRPISSWLPNAPVIDSPAQYIEGSPLDRFVFTVLLMACVIVVFRRRSQVSDLLKANRPILLFFGFCLLSIAWSDYSFVALKRWIKGLGDLLIVLIILTDSDQLSAIKRLLARAGFLLIPLSVLFIKYFPDLGRTYNPWTWEPSFSGVAMGKNMLGMICLLFGLGSLWRFLDEYGSPRGKARSRRLVAHGILLAMVSWLLWTANSMTSFACFILAGGMIVATKWRGTAGKAWVVHALFVSMVILSLSAVFNIFGGLVHAMGRDSTLTGRTDIWNVVLSVSGNPLIGTGYESFWLGDRLQEVWDRTAKGIQEAHNGYLEMYLNLGWVGVILLAGIVIAGYRNILAAYCRNSKMSGLKMACLTAALVYGLTEAGFRMMTPIWVFTLWAAMAVPEAEPC
jgi:exopolysaccharide production protein ExoQ